ncbi:type 1 glutamine amidotransferase [Bdellovibrio bacteriovorus]|uniref:type 1 glutamine amidotransferase n=1 Tax=Bdellovibrio bacteriovorus TaxID=959 RepID=UPI0035A5BF75
MKSLLVIQHEADTPPGTTLEWAALRGYTVHHWSPGTDAPPVKTDFDLVVICGGSMDTFEEEKHPWLVVEKEFIRKLVKNNTKIFGLCLGSQLLAEILGGSVHQHHGWEIGFVPVKTRDASTLQAFHWHRYTFELPPGAELLCEGSFCKNQAFTFGKNIMATQFHPETTEQWIRECAEEVALNEKAYTGLVQSEKDMLASLPLQKDLKHWYFDQLDQLVK